MMNTAARLLLGSRNIDRMRSEITATVAMILGLLEKREDCTLSETFNEEFSFTGGMWLAKGGIRRSIGGNVIDSNVCVECWLRHTGVRLEYSSQKGGVQLHVGSVQDVYEALPSFIEGMQRVRPDLENKLRLFLRASDVKF